MDMAMRFMDIRKRVYTFPKMGEKAYFIAVPTSAGTGSEVTPFAVITDEKSGVKYPLADYELLPKMAIIDADMMMSMPKGLTSASGIDAMTHALEAYASMMATDYTDGLALKALKNIFTYLPSAYENGANDPKAREKMADASTMAGIAFANAFLGVCHSMAHKLGAFHHLPAWRGQRPAYHRGHALQCERPSRQDGHLPAVRVSAHPRAVRGMRRFPRHQGQEQPGEVREPAGRH